MYFLDVIRYFRPLFLKKPQHRINTHTMMNSTYLKVAWRYMLRNRIYTAINLLGLAIGIVCTAFIALYTLDELSYDSFHAQADRIVRIVENQTDQEGKVAEMASSYGAMTPVLQTAIPELEHLTRVLPQNPLVSLGKEKQFQESGFFYVDSTFLDIFDFPLVRGNQASVLDDPFSLVITASTAQKYFANKNPIGEILTVRGEDNSHDFKITGVLEDLPSNSHIQFDFLASYSSLRTLIPG